MVPSVLVALTLMQKVGMEGALRTTWWAGLRRKAESTEIATILYELMAYLEGR
jgi:hypothetical protein